MSTLYSQPGIGGFSTYLEWTVATAEERDEVGPGMFEDAQGVFLSTRGNVGEAPGSLQLQLLILSREDTHKCCHGILFPVGQGNVLMLMHRILYDSDICLGRNLLLFNKKNSNILLNWFTSYGSCRST